MPKVVRVDPPFAKAMTIRASAALLALLAAIPTQAVAGSPPMTLEAVNAASFSPLPDTAAKRPDPEVLKAEVLLDRARFSPGAIDGVDGDNFRKAVGAYQATMGLAVTSRLDQETWDRLVRDDARPVLAVRTTTKDDVEGPFSKRLPRKMEAQARVGHMRYGSPLEKLSEEVHASQGLLRTLNLKRRFDEAGKDLVVTQVVTGRPSTTVARVVVDKAGHAVQAFGADGKLVAFYPASIGSTEKPAPSGEFVIERVTHNPGYRYDPKYAFKGVTSKVPFTIQSGPNNPVGSVWMALSDEGYGIHGTPDPDLVGKTQSHGCIRLTNWDAEDLAGMVGSNTPVSFQDTAAPLPRRDDSSKDIPAQ